MSPTTLRIVIALIFFVHGIGHSMGILSAVGLSTMDTWHSRSWLLTNLIGDKAARVFSIIIWGIAALGFIAAGLALLDWLVPHELWRTLSVISATVSLVGLALFWFSFATNLNRIGALLVDIAVLVCLLILNWPTEADIGY